MGTPGGLVTCPDHTGRKWQGPVFFLDLLLLMPIQFPPFSLSQASVESCGIYSCPFIPVIFLPHVPKTERVNSTSGQGAGVMGPEKISLVRTDEEQRRRGPVYTHYTGGTR